MTLGFLNRQRVSQAYLLFFYERNPRVISKTLKHDQLAPLRLGPQRCHSPMHPPFWLSQTIASSLPDMSSNSEMLHMLFFFFCTDCFSIILTILKLEHFLILDIDLSLIIFLFDRQAELDVTFCVLKPSFSQSI